MIDTESECRGNEETGAKPAPVFCAEIFIASQ